MLPDLPRLLAPICLMLYLNRRIIDFMAKELNLQQRADLAFKQWKKEKADRKAAARHTKNRRRKERLKARKRQLEVWKLRYHEYIRSPEWRAFVRELIEDRGSICEDCYEEGPVEGHHHTYARLRCERKNDVILLCRHCHAAHHESKWLREDELFKEFSAIVRG